MTKHSSIDRQDRPSHNSRRFGHLCLAHRPTGSDTEEQYVTLIRDRLDLRPWTCWQVSISEADRDRWKLQRYLTRQTSERSGTITAADNRAVAEIERRACQRPHLSHPDCADLSYDELDYHEHSRYREYNDWE